MNRFSPLHGILMVFCLVVGVVIGGLGPRSDARSLRAQLAKSKECKTGVGADIANIFRSRPWEKHNQTSSEKEPSIAKNKAPNFSNNSEDDGVVTVQLDVGKETDEEQSLDQQIDLARDVMELRYNQAMEALKQDADPTEKQLTEIDQVIEKMNDELMGLANDLAGEITSGEVSRHGMMLYAAETLDVLLETEDQLGSVLTKEQQDALQDKSLDPMSYVDPALIDVLSKLEE